MSNEMLCGHCKNFDRCNSLIQRKLTDKPCDWVPSRFVYDPKRFGEGKANDGFDK